MDEEPEVLEDVDEPEPPVEEVPVDPVLEEPEVDVPDPELPDPELPPDPPVDEVVEGGEDDEEELFDPEDPERLSVR